MVDSESSLIMLMQFYCFLSVTYPGSGWEREATRSNQQIVGKGQNSICDERTANRQGQLITTVKPINKENRKKTEKKKHKKKQGAKLSLL